MKDKDDARFCVGAGLLFLLIAGWQYGVNLPIARRLDTDALIRSFDEGGILHDGNHAFEAIATAGFCAGVAIVLIAAGGVAMWRSRRATA